LIVALAALLIVVIRWVVLSTEAQGGRLVYALDDPYIHMAIAKNLARHGVWGITRYEASAASSSPLWTLLLAAIYRITGPREIAPFVLNLLCAALTLGLMAAQFRRYHLPPLFSLIMLLAVIFLTPLPTLIFTGQEHILHLLLTVAFTVLAVRALQDDDLTLRSRPLWGCMALAAVLPVVRYEALFLIAVAVILLGLRGRWAWAVLIAACAVTPLLIYGALNVSSGGFWFPNPIMLKSRFSAANSLDGTIEPTLRLFKFDYLKAFYWELFGGGMLPITLLIVAALVVYTARSLRRPEIADARRPMLILFAGGALLHLRLASLGWFYRYEAYLIGWGLFVLALALGDEVARLFSSDQPSAISDQPKHERTATAPGAIIVFLRQRLRLRNIVLARLAAGIAVVIAFGFPLFNRAWYAYHETLTATWDIYAQQVQMGEFIHTYYDQRGVALNDVGAASFLTDARILDLWGLGNNEVAWERYHGFYDTYRIERLGYDNSARIAIVYPQSFEEFGGIPDTWVRIGEWTLPSMVAVAYPTVVFYAIDLMEINPLAAHLKEFEAYLPPGVRTTLSVEPITPSY
jgi:hypothetical protein